MVHCLFYRGKAPNMSSQIVIPRQSNIRAIYEIIKVKAECIFVTTSMNIQGTQHHSSELGVQDERANRKTEVVVLFPEIKRDITVIARNVMVPFWEFHGCGSRTITTG